MRNFPTKRKLNKKQFRYNSTIGFHGGHLPRECFDGQSHSPSLRRSVRQTRTFVSCSICQTAVRWRERVRKRLLLCGRWKAPRPPLSRLLLLLYLSPSFPSPLSLSLSLYLSSNKKRSYYRLSTTRGGGGCSFD